MKEIRNRVALLPITLSLFAGSAMTLTAQTTPTTPTASATCTTAPTSLSTLSIERVLTLSNILTTLTPNVPANILAAISGGAQEIRTRLIYNPQQNTLTDTTFTVATGSPIPTPLSVDVTASVIQTYTITVSQVYTSCTPTPSLLIVGKVTSGGTSPFGNFSGAPVAISLGYTTDNPPAINNVVELVAGSALAYSAAGQGTVTFPAVPVTPPGSGGGAPTIILNPAPPTSGSIQVFTNPYFENAAASTDPNNLQLTYKWSSVPPANFGPSDTVPNPTITFVSGQADYTITLTVTNSAGQSSSQTFTVEFLGR